MLKSELCYYLVTLTTARRLEKNGERYQAWEDSTTSVLKAPDFLLHIEGERVIASGESETKEKSKQNITGDIEIKNIVKIATREWGGTSGEKGL